MTRVEELVRLAEVIKMEEELDNDDISDSEKEAIAYSLSNIDCNADRNSVKPQEVIRYLEMSRQSLEEQQKELFNVKYVYEYTEHKLSMFGSYVTDEGFIDSVEFKLASLESRIEKLEKTIKILKYNIVMLEYLDNELSTKEVM